MTRKRKADGLWVDVPLPPAVEGALVFSIHFNEAEVRALSVGLVPLGIQETCVGLLDWLNDVPGEAAQKIRPASTMRHRTVAERSDTGDPLGESIPTNAADRPTERLV